MIQIAQKIVPSLWFDKEGEEAANFYISIFDNSRIVSITRYGEAGPGPEGSVLTVDFELAGQRFIALNGGPHFPFSHAISFLVNCETQDEVDYMWEKLSAGGATEQCGWLKDKFGVSWQIFPIVMGGMLTDPDPVKTQNVIRAMMKMDKLDIEGLKKAYEQQ